MIKSSQALDFAVHHCVRHPIADPSLVWDRSLADQFILCQTPLCDQVAVPYCSQFGGALAPYNYNSFSERCNLLSWEYNFERDEFWGGLTKSFADLTLANYNGRYSYFYKPPYTTCEGATTTIAGGVDTYPGIPLRLRTGFKWRDNECNWHEEYINRFIGTSSDFPEIDTTDGGRSTARFHFEDAIGKIADYPLSNSYTFTNVLVSDVIKTLLADAGISNIYIPDAGTQLVSFTANVNDKLGDWLRKLCFMELGSIYQSSNGVLRFDTGNYDTGKSLDSECVATFDTWDNIIDVSQESWNNIKNIIKVQQFSNSGGIEYTAKAMPSIRKFGAQYLTIANELITSVAQAQALAERLLRLHAYGSRERVMKIKADPRLELGDVVCLRERVTRDMRNGCCETIYQDTKYMIQRIHGSGPSPYNQEITLSKVGFAKKCFILCETLLCDFDYQLCNTCV
jgi:hypothetical protein